MRRHALRTLLTAVAMTLAGWSGTTGTAGAQAFDPQDPYRRVFLDMMLTFTSAAAEDQFIFNEIRESYLNMIG